jgi:chloramphenicol 3-O-phosphotransferase
LKVTATIVLLNGVGSAGKSSIARALQQITAEPFLYVQMDTFIEMLPTPRRTMRMVFPMKPSNGRQAGGRHQNRAGWGANPARHAPSHCGDCRAGQQSHR